MKNKILIALVLVVGLSGILFAEIDFDKLVPLSDEELKNISVYQTSEQIKENNKQNSLEKQYNNCQKIRENLYDNCILKNLNTSDPSSIREIRNIYERKSKKIPFEKL